MLGLRPLSFRALIPLRDVQWCVCGLDVSPNVRRDRHASRSVPMGLPTMPKPASWCRRYCLVGRDEVMRARTCDVRFASRSRHLGWPSARPLCANRRHHTAWLDRLIGAASTSGQPTEDCDRETAVGSSNLSCCSHTSITPRL
jgi:hypothetical protein